MKMCSKCKKVLPLTAFCGGKNTYSCKPCMKEYKGKYYVDNKKKLRKQMADRHKERMMKDPEYKDRHNSRNKDWRDNNKDKCKEYCDKYRALKVRAQPVWANKKYMALFHKFARLEEARIGKPVHVDHIIPLEHPRVCGLHCEHNLQLLTAEANRRKGNNF